MQDEVIYRCVNGACARPLPRRVNFCPFCGTSQSTGLPRPGDAPAPVSIAKPVPAPPPVAVAAAPVPVAPAPAAVPPAAAAAPRATSATAPRATSAARPPQRQPVRLRYWLLALGLLWLIWITQKPSAEKIDARIDNAIALANACKAAQAQGELIALNDSKATPAQLKRLQSALNSADAACERKRSRARPAAKPARPLASQQAQSAANLIADARRALVLGNYKAASDKMEVCAAMVDPDNRECIDLKARADRLQAEMRACVADGRDWFNDRCQ